MKTIWILGAGKFGQKAIAALKDKNRLLVIDQTIPDHPVLAGCDTVRADGIDYLSRHLEAQGPPDWIVPAIPVHVSYEWICNKLDNIRPIPVPPALAEQMPNPFRGKAGELYVSNADFICPDNCPEPADICTYTGKPRPRILYKTLQNLEFENFCAVGVQSHQLSPGVGGYRPQALFDALEAVSQGLKTGPVLVSTACRCHGVIHALEKCSP